MGRKRKLKAFAAIFLGSLILMVSYNELWGTGTEAVEVELTGSSTNRKLMAVAVYPMVINPYLQCVEDGGCGNDENCRVECNGNANCLGYKAISPTKGEMCKNLTTSLTFVGETLYRRPGPPCLVNDTVVTSLDPLLRREGMVQWIDSNDALVLINGAVIPEMFKVPDIYRHNAYTAQNESCNIVISENRLYPNEAFSKSQRKNGALVLYACGVLYMFFALAIVCDDYFVPALESLAVKLQLSDDVAGATFMAAGGSAPELFTSFIGVFIAQSDVGFGTIIGSAVFNVLFVIGACSIATRELAKDVGGLPLTWWPLARDSTFYLVDLVLLMVFFIDKKIEIWESGILIACYSMYVIFMAYNLPVYTKVRSILDRRSGKVVPDEEADKPSYPTTEDGALKTKASQKEDDKDKCGSGWAQAKTRARSNSTSHILTRQQRSGSKAKADDEKPKEPDSDNQKEEEMEEARVQEEEEDEEDEPWSPKPPAEGLVKWVLLFPLNFPLWLVLPSGVSLGAEKDMFTREHKLTALSCRLMEFGGLKKKSDGKKILPSVTWLKDHSAQLVHVKDDDLRDEDDTRPGGEVLVSLITSFETEATSGHDEAAAFLGWATSADSTPVEYRKALKQKYGSFFGRLYVGGFLGSIMWIGWFTYLTVWWAETIGKDLGISEVVMGITFLAAGTSVPDLISSVIVARDGKGDMAVSSSIGSNIFDATFGLPVPWFFWSIAHSGKAITVEANALGTSVLMLVGMLICIISAIALLGWRLNVMLGGLSLILYAIFVTITILMSYGHIPTAF